MKRFFGEKNAPALSMLPQRSSSDFTGHTTSSSTTGLTSPQPLSQGAMYSPTPSYGRNSVNPVVNGVDAAQQQQHYFDLAAASTLYMQAVNTGSNAAIPTPSVVGQPALTPPPPVLAQVAQQQQSSPLPSPGRLSAQLTSYPAVGPDDSASVAGQMPASDANNNLDRNDLHKVLRSLEGLLVGLDEYRDLALKMAKVEKKIAKSAAEIAKIKSVKHVPSQVLGCSGLHFDAMNETNTKHAKLVQKEYEAVNEACAKYFKRVAKEERAHDEFVEALDSKIKKAHASQEKNAKRAGPRAMEAHDKYIAQVSTLTNDIAMAKASHAASMGAKTHAISLVVASTVGGLADARFRSSCESIRKTGKEIGPLNAWLNFAVSEAMPDQQPLDLDEDDLVGPAARLEEARVYAQAQLQAQAQATQAFAQAQMQNSAAAILASQLQQQQQSQTRNDDKDASADDTSQGITTMNSISPSQSKGDSSHRAEATPSVKFADLPKLDSEGKLVSESSNGTNSQRTSNGPDFRERIKAEDSLRSDPNTPTSDSKKLSSEPSQGQQQPRSILTAPSAGRTDTKYHSSVIAEADEDGEEDEEDDQSISVKRVAEMNNVGPAGVSTVTTSVKTSAQEPSKDALSTQESSTVAATKASLSTQRSAKDEDDMLTSSVANLAATLTIPGGSKGNSGGDKKEPSSSDTSSSRLRESSSSTAETASRRAESDSTPALTSSSSRPSSEESAPVASPRQLYPMRQTATPSAIEEKLDDHRAGGLQKQTDGAERVTSSPRRFPSAEPTRKDSSAFDSRDVSQQDAQQHSYTPIVIGQSRIASASVSRTLSTDTTASERSFVARMKAKYQAEKEGLRQATWVPTTTAGAAPYDTGLPAYVGGQERGRRVSELASHYGTSSIGSSVAGPRHSFPAGGLPPQQQGSYGGNRGRYAPEDDRPLSPPNPHHLHTASTTSSSRGGGPVPARDGHYSTSSTTLGGAPSNQARFRGNEAYHDRYDEFGTVKSGRSAFGGGGVSPGSMPSSSSVIRPTPIPATRGVGGGTGERGGAGDGMRSTASSRFGGGPSIFDEKDAGSSAPHSDVCGCQRCSIRHYSDVNNGTGAGNNGNSARAERGPYDSHSYRSDHTYQQQQQQQAQRNDVRDWDRDPRAMSNNRRQTMPVPPSNASAFSNGRYDRDERDRERVVSGGGGGPSYGAQFMRPPPVNDDRYGGGSLPRDAGGRSGRTSPYGMNLARDEARFAQGRAQATNLTTLNDQLRIEYDHAATQP
ncbi:hypothetical protein OC846_005923 [Tilletia horrida]|uniref:F-BAR domain-containing protein n=1 Tax=Tilletia horrida TaxID=155126 RepID=A0AAN6GJL4_9BASI|nr:hypothetical protein OC846_005923 [Tilletia horrida]